MEQITNLPLGNLHESPTNPRKSFGVAGLQELADSLRSQGVMSPIVVRPHPSPSLALHYEIVFGHRRFRAAQLAELDGIPAIIRQLTDEQAGLAQLHENLEREDVSPVEEAEAYKRLMTDHGVTAELLMTQTGKSKSYIYGRLKLNALAPAVRQACADGLPTDVALKIARIHPPSLQVKALAKMRNADDTWLSVRQGLQVLDAMRHTIPLHSAIFDPASICGSCQHRSDNDPDLLLALGTDVCTYANCFDDVTTATHDRRFTTHAAAGLPTFEGTDALAALAGSNWPASYTDGRNYVDTHVCHRLMYAATYDETIAQLLQRMGEIAPPIALAKDPQGRIVDLLAIEHLPALQAFLASHAGASTPPSAARATQGGDADANDDDGDGLGKLPGAALTTLPTTPEEIAAGNAWSPINAAIMRRAAATTRRTAADLATEAGPAGADAAQASARLDAPPKLGFINHELPLIPSDCASAELSSQLTPASAVGASAEAYALNTAGA